MSEGTRLWRSSRRRRDSRSFSSLNSEDNSGAAGAVVMVAEDCDRDILGG